MNDDINDLELEVQRLEEALENALEELDNAKAELDAIKEPQETPVIAWKKIAARYRKDLYEHPEWFQIDTDRRDKISAAVMEALA